MNQHIPPPNQKTHATDPGLLAHSCQTQPANPARDARIEDYLDHVCAPLVAHVPYARREELRREIHSHLEALIYSHRELGTDPDEAVLAALRQFGNPHRIGQQWLRAATRPLPSPSGSWKAIGMLVVVFLIANNIPNYLMHKLMENDPESAQFLGMVLGLIDMVVRPLALGALVGLLTDRAANRPIYVSLGLLSVSWIGLALVSLPPGSRDFLSISLGITLFLAQIPLLGLAGAALGRKLRLKLLEPKVRWSPR